MRKILLMLLATSMIFTLTACGEAPPEEIVGDEENIAEQVDSPNEKVEESEDVYFKDNTVKIEDLKIKITNTKIIPVGEPGNQYGEKPVFAIWYETTNLSDKDINPSIAWISVFTAIQDNDPNLINELEVGMLPDENHSDTQLKTIKKDGTVENSIAYELDDLETPVVLVANQGVMGEEIGRKEYKIK